MKFIRMFPLLLIFTLMACPHGDIFCPLTIENNSGEKITVITYGSSIISGRDFVLIQQDGERFEYELDAGVSDDLIIHSSDNDIDEEDIPFDRLDIISSNDSLLLRSKKEILESFEKRLDCELFLTIN